jgi:hypothetical protein
LSAQPPSRLIERGKYGVSVWTTVLLDKFLYARPSHRLLKDLADHGLNMPPGTLAGGLHTLAPLFEPLNQALLGKLRSEAHWHADETRWAVFATMQGKVGHRWYLWAFHSRSVVHYALDRSRSTKVIQGELDGVVSGIISCAPLLGVQEVRAPEPRGPARVLLGPCATRLPRTGQLLSAFVGVGDGLGGRHRRAVSLERAALAGRARQRRAHRAPRCATAGRATHVR